MDPNSAGFIASNLMITANEMLFKYGDNNSNDDVWLNNHHRVAQPPSKQNMATSTESHNDYCTTDPVDNDVPGGGASKMMNSTSMCSIDTDNRDGNFVPCEVHHQQQQQSLDNDNERTTTTTVTPTSSPTYERRGRFLIWPVSVNDQLFISTLDHEVSSCTSTTTTTKIQ